MPPRQAVERFAAIGEAGVTSDQCRMIRPPHQATCRYANLQGANLQGARYYSAACGTVSPSFTPRTAYSAATRTASTMLTALALPVPAMSNAVP